MKKLEQTFLWIFLFTIPFGARTLLFAGTNEYQSRFLYASDIALIGLFLMWLFFEHKKKSIDRALSIPLALLISWFFLSSVFSPNSFLGFYQTTKLIEFLWLFYYIRSMKFPEIVFQAIVASALFQSLIAIAQFASQHSLGLRLLGEQVLAPIIAGVAKLDVGGEKLVRAYGTFPHPNVLAVFLFLTLFVLVASFARPSKSGDTFKLICIPFLTLALLLTFSRVVIILSVFIILFSLFVRKERGMLGVFLLSLAIFFVILSPYLPLAAFLSRFSIDPQEQAVNLRLFYAKNALSATRTHPLLGVGPGQFTRYQEQTIIKNKLPEWINQPAHNIYLLLAAEAGLPALFFFFCFLFALFSHSRKSTILNSLFIILFVIGLFDHFFFTYQQGALLFWLTLGLSSGKVKELKEERSKI